MSHYTAQRVERHYLIVAGNKEITSLTCSHARMKALVKRYRAQLRTNVRAIPC